MTWTVPRTFGRSEGDMVKHGHREQLDLFRETLTRPAKLLVMAMFGLSDPKHLDRPQSAKIADILRTAGYNQRQREDGKKAFTPATYELVEETGLKLRRQPIPFFVREQAGHTKDGRRKWKAGLIETAVFQDFGFFYEDEEGQPIDLDEIPKGQLIKYEDGKKVALYAIPMTDEDGNIVYNKDGVTPRRRVANGVTWSFASRLARLATDRGTSWVFYLEAGGILRRYQAKPATFDLMFKTLFWTGTGLIEVGHDKLVEHLGIKSKDGRQVQAAIDAAFADMLAEGIIDKPVTVRPRGYYQPTKKAGRPRRTDQVYQWRRAAKWQPGKGGIAIADESLPAEDPKSGNPE